MKEEPVTIVSSTFDVERGTGTVTIQSAERHSLHGLSVTNKVLDLARAHGIASPGIKAGGADYYVAEERPPAYRRDVLVVRGI
jgi:hypothetical protein